MNRKVHIDQRYRKERKERDYFIQLHSEAMACGCEGELQGREEKKMEPKPHKITR